MTQSIDFNSSIGQSVNKQRIRLNDEIYWCKNEKSNLEERLNEANDELAEFILWAEMADAKPGLVDAYTPFEYEYHSEFITKNYSNMNKIENSIAELEYKIHNFHDSIIWYYKSLLKLDADWIIE